MNRPLVSLLMVGIVCLAASATDDKKPMTDDPTATELTKAKEEYQEAVKGAGEKLVAAFTEQQKKLEENTKLKVAEQIKLVEKVQEERKAFETDQSKLPKSPSMKVAVSDYQMKTAAAKKKCEAAFDKAAEAYRGKKDLASAKVVLAEKDEFLSKADPGVAADLFPAGSVWRGERKIGTYTSRLELVIKERKGETFEGEIDLNGNGSIFKVEGTGAGAEMKFSTEQRGTVQQNFKGELKGKQLTFTLNGTNNKNERIGGNATMSRVK